ncbi:hypothetical protein QFC24_002302 [Naganishia onofrii]|uniref:Uncharacterized protein n=1 Tax=Naganishia onofrii TaxID=1851511 RepID=A0ACC2XRM8_9TREE|nr:hypothetical protein QFC24_002302 [Naganishia onofrii]
MPASPYSRIYFAQAWLLTIYLVLCFGSQSGQAHSLRPGPLKRIFHPRNIATQVIPRAIPHDSPHNPPDGLYKRSTGETWQDGKRKRSLVSRDKLLPSDALRLSLDIPTVRHLVSRDLHDAEESYETVHLHVTPTEHLFHPQAKVNYLSAAGDVVHSEPLRAHDHRVYTGEVIADWSTSQRLKEDKVGGVYYSPEGQAYRGVRGTATIHVYEHAGDIEEQQGQSSKTSFAGTFNVDGQLWHVMTKENYLRHAQLGDPQPQVHDLGGSESGLVMFLEGDEDEQREAPLLQSSAARLAQTGCSHDSLAFNTNVTGHPVLKERPRHPHSANDIVPSFFPSLPSIPFPDSFSPLRSFAGDSSPRGISRRDDISTGGNAQPSTNYISTIGQTTGCPTEQRVVYMGVAADCNYISTYGGSEQARTQILTNWNSITALYRRSFNISLGIIELNVMNETCPSASAASSSSTQWNTPCAEGVTLNDRLSLFSEWRGRAGNGQAGLYHLMTACPTDTEVGVAWLGTLCQTDSSSQSGQTVSGTGVSSASRTEWSLSSHEIGHNFGAIHDLANSYQEPFVTPRRIFVAPVAAAMQATRHFAELLRMMLAISQNIVLEVPGHARLIRLRRMNYEYGAPPQHYSRDESASYGYEQHPPRNVPNGYYPMQQRNSQQAGWVDPNYYNGPNFRN